VWLPFRAPGECRQASVVGKSWLKEAPPGSAMVWLRPPEEDPGKSKAFRLLPHGDAPAMANPGMEGTMV